MISRVDQYDLFALVVAISKQDTLSCLAMSVMHQCMDLYDFKVWPQKVRKSNQTL